MPETQSAILHGTCGTHFCENTMAAVILVMLDHVHNEPPKFENAFLSKPYIHTKGFKLSACQIIEL